jgi:hypothetical protein
MTDRVLRPPPDLHALIAQFGSYSAIPHKAWEHFDREMEKWKADVRNGCALVRPASRNDKGKVRA